MEIIAFKKEQEQYRQHQRRIQKMQPLIDTGMPESLGLRHLKVLRIL
jgi:hypothetical protein